MKFMKKIKLIKNCKRNISVNFGNTLLLEQFKNEWRKDNENNGTVPVNLFEKAKVKVGEGTYGGLYVLGFDNSEENLIIGRYCSIAADVCWILGGEHNYRTLMSYPFETHILNLKTNDKTPTKGTITVGDDVWIGRGCTILSGVNIGKGAVIGAGGVVSKDIPEFAIFAGNKVIGYRFKEEIRKLLVKIDYATIKKMTDDEKRFVLKNRITEDNVLSIIELFEKYEK